jgi:DNA invertase Pin-like site-specific DNA recombinase
MKPPRPPRAILFLAVSTARQAADDRASLPEQERVLRETAEAQGWHVADVIRIPGVSRGHYTYAEFAAAANQVGVTDAARMFDHWRARDFDVLAAVTFSRLGREQSILNEVIRRTIDVGARVYAVQGGWVTDENADPMGAIEGLLVATERREIRRRHRFGTQARFDKGQPYARPPAPYLEIRNLSGKLERIEVREDWRRLFDDIHQLVVERRVGLRYVEVELAKLGHPLLPEKTVSEWLRNPVIWGHTARGDKHARRLRDWAWVYDARHPLPEGVQILRHTHPPVWTGEQAESLQAELLRRQRAAPRRRQPDRTYRFSGLIICARCGRTMTYNVVPGRNGARYRTLACAGRKQPARRCDQPIRMEHQCAGDIRQFLADVFAAADALTLFEQPADARESQAARAEQLRAEIAQVEAQIDTLIDKQASAPANLSGRYDAKLRECATRLEALEAERTRVTAVTEKSAHRARAAADLRATGLDAFWALPEPEQNQLLHRLMDGARFVWESGHIVGLR